MRQGSDAVFYLIQVLSLEIHAMISSNTDGEMNGLGNEFEFPAFMTVNKINQRHIQLHNKNLFEWASTLQNLRYSKKVNISCYEKNFPPLVTVDNIKQQNFVLVVLFMLPRKKTGLSKTISILGRPALKSGFKVIPKTDMYTVVCHIIITKYDPSPVY